MHLVVHKVVIFLRFTIFLLEKRRKKKKAGKMSRQVLLMCNSMSLLYATIFCKHYMHSEKFDVLEDSYFEVLILLDVNRDCCAS